MSGGCDSGRSLSKLGEGLKNCTPSGAGVPEMLAFLPGGQSGSGGPGRNGLGRKSGFITTGGASRVLGGAGGSLLRSPSKSLTGWGLTDGVAACPQALFSPTLFSAMKMKKIQIRSATQRWFLLSSQPQNSHESGLNVILCLKIAIDALESINASC